MHNESYKPVEQPDLSRRRFTRAGLSGSVVLGSLASKPVLGASTTHCTVSGQVSGNLSRVAVASACQIGDPPSDWITATPWPSGFTKGELPNKNCQFTSDNGSRPRGTVFNGYTPGGGVPALTNAFFNWETGTGQTQACSVVLTGSAEALDTFATMLQVLSTTDTSEQYLLGRVVVASLLNAAKFVNYPVTPHTIIAMFNATFNGGNYYPLGPTNMSAFWTRTRVIEYLQGLFGLPA